MEQSEAQAVDKRFVLQLLQRQRAASEFQRNLQTALGLYPNLAFQLISRLGQICQREQGDAVANLQLAVGGGIARAAQRAEQNPDQQCSGTLPALAAGSRPIHTCH